MDEMLRGKILEAQRATREAEGRPTPEDLKTQYQIEEMKALGRFITHVELASLGKIRPVAEWTGSAAVARFTLDEQPFTLLKDGSKFVLFADDECGQELSRIKVKEDFLGTTKFLSALGDFLSIA